MPGNGFDSRRGWNEEVFPKYTEKYHLTEDDLQVIYETYNATVFNAYLEHVSRHPFMNMVPTVEEFAIVNELPIGDPSVERFYRNETGLEIATFSSFRAWCLEYGISEQRALIEPCEEKEEKSFVIKRF